MFTLCCGKDIKDVFLTEYDLVDCFTGQELWTWGRNTDPLADPLYAYGQLGDNTSIDKSSPVQTVSGGNNWKQVSANNGHAAAIKTDGTLWTWGNNSAGQLGNNNTVSRSSPVQTVSGGTNWRNVSVGSGFTAAIKTDGTLWTWGFNNNGQLGNGDSGSGTNRSSPVQTAAGGTNWKNVSVGNAHTAALKTDGTLWLWGNGQCGALGNSETAERVSPVQTVAGSTNWKQVSAGDYFTAAVKTDGTLWLWGDNRVGNLGNNSTNLGIWSPIQTISGGTNWKQVSAGSDGLLTAAIKNDGTLWTWGCGSFGRLGNNNTIDVSSPVQTIAGGTSWKQVSASYRNTLAIKTDGTLWAWGDSYSGALGTNSTVRVSSPVQTAAGGTNWKQASIGTSVAMALKITE